MRTQTFWVCGLVLGIVLSTSTTVRAETRTSSSLSAFPGDLRVFPARTNGEAARTVIGDVDLAVGNVAGAGEKLLYSNTLGTFAAEFPANLLIADDISITAANGCPLSRFTFEVIGKANPNSCGGPEGNCGPYTVNFALYDNCPGAGGVPIADTVGEVTFDDDVVHTIEVVIPSGTDVPLPPTVWLGVRMSRNNAGVILGAPALWGFSSDILDFPGFPCIANVGGFPRNPHASYNAELYGRDTCEDTFVTYRNISPGRGGINATPGAWWADDIELNTDNCLMTAFEYGVKGVGLYRFRLHRSAGGCPGAEIDRTRQAFLAQDDNAKLARITFDPPIQLPSRNLWAAISSNNGGAVWILTGQDASVGSTDATFAVNIDGACSTTFPPGQQVHGGFHVVITCAGNAPTGACCDMFVRNNGVCAFGACVGGDFDGSICTTSQQCRGDATCRTLPQANCSFPTKGSAARPAWKVGSSCNVCVGGANDGAACETETVCVGGANEGESCEDDLACAPGVCGSPACVPKACDGEPDEGRPCTNDEECGDASCTSGICEGHNPFEPLPSCGVSACCAPDAGCDNLTERECAFLPPLDKPRVWEVGQFCGLQGQRCPLPACLARAGDCTAPRLKFCRGGTSDGEECFLDSNCPGGSDGICVDLIPTPICLGGNRAGEECGDDLDCILGGTCMSSICVGGDFDGTKCEEPRDCRGSICEGQPGCRDPFCCTDVCNFAPGPILFTEFCCQVHWDAECAALAQNPEICDDLQVGNDDCAPGDRTPGAMEIPMNDRRTVSGDQATDTGSEPGFCCHGGRFKCDGGCNDEEFCFDDGDCQGTDDGYCTYGGDPVTGTCVGGCNAQERCEEDVICQGGDRAGQPCNFKCVGGFDEGNECTDPSDCSSEVCDDSQDCPGGVCVGDFCDGSEPGTCSIFEPAPGAQGFGSVWYWFTVPEDGDPGGTMSVQIDTCSSNAPAKDSMLEVFAVRDNDAGRCDGLGQCAGSRDLCNVTTQDCEDFSECVETSVVCSVSAQDCPAEATCVLDRTAACEELSLIGCNDDAADGCGNTTQAQNSKLCFPDLIRGDTYYIMVAAKTPDMIGSYQVNVRQVSNCSGLLDLVENDYCPNAIPIFDGITPFDLTDTTFDCPADSCLLNLQNDEWFEYIAPFTGRATIEACGGSIETTPDTELIVYDSCDCPSANGRSLSTLCCNGLAGGDCLLGARCEIDIVAGKCYKIRIGDNRGGGAIGELLIFAEPADCDGNGIGDNCDIACGPGGGECDVEGCGTAADCNENGIPDQCDTRDQTSADCNGNDIPDECETDCNENNVPDDCDIRDGDADDCQLNGVPDFCEIRDGDCPDVDPQDGECDDCAEANLIDTSPPATTPGEPPAGSLWRSANNIVRFTFDTDISAPNPGDVEIVKMVDDGGCVAGYDVDLSASFTFEVELDGDNNPRILKIQEVDTVLEHQKWYAMRNVGAWTGVAPFEAQWLLQVGDADDNGLTLSLDVGAVNGGIPCLSGCGDDNRLDVDGDGRILSLDVGTINGRIPSFAQPKPCGH